jgi:hypothetical protein
MAGKEEGQSSMHWLKKCNELLHTNDHRKGTKTVVVLACKHHFVGADTYQPAAA